MNIPPHYSICLDASNRNEIISLFMENYHLYRKILHTPNLCNRSITGIPFLIINESVIVSLISDIVVFFDIEDINIIEHEWYHARGGTLRTRKGSITIPMEKMIYENTKKNSLLVRMKPIQWEDRYRNYRRVSILKTIGSPNHLYKRDTISISDEE